MSSGNLNSRRNFYRSINDIIEDLRITRDQFYFGEF